MGISALRRRACYPCRSEDSPPALARLRAPLPASACLRARCAAAGGREPGAQPGAAADGHQGPAPARHPVFCFLGGQGHCAAQPGERTAAGPCSARAHRLLHGNNCCVVRERTGCDMETTAVWRASAQAATWQRLLCGAQAHRLLCGSDCCVARKRTGCDMATTAVWRASAQAAISQRLLCGAHRGVTCVFHCAICPAWSHFATHTPQRCPHCAILCMVPLWHTHTRAHTPQRCPHCAILCMVLPAQVPLDLAPNRWTTLVVPLAHLATLLSR